MKARREGKSYVIDAILLYTNKEIVEHLMISAMEEIEGIYLHVSYETILDTKKSCRMDRRIFNKNQNSRRNRRRSVDNLREGMKK